MRTEQAWIPMPDGVRLSATLYLPDDEGLHPVLLEYLPYRKDDGLLSRDHDLYAYMTRAGYVGARVDIRGTGRSEGVVPPFEYSEQEQDDGEAVIEWLASQPWSTGAIGMWGISWGGFNAIQMGTRPPPALRAIVALHASDDLFHDDVHYVDGLMHLDEYELMIDALNPLPPAPDFPTDEETLAARFDREPWILEKMRHQRDGPFWRRGSLRPDYERLEVPALLIGGWYDGYRDTVPRVLEGSRVPTRAIVGPWDHSFPHRASHGAIEWRAEAVRWWDRWLREERSGIEDEPRLAVFVRDHHSPGEVESIPGRWRLERTWPPERLEERTLWPGDGGGLVDSRSAGEHHLPYDPSIGIEAGSWWGEVQPDQSPLDARCLAYETEPLEEPLEILGMPRAELRSSVDAPIANWFVRLSDVAPDGRATLVSGGGLSGAQRVSAEDPSPLEPGEPHDLVVPMRFTSWRFPAGHHIRLAVSNALFPMTWPTPHPMTMTLHLEGSQLVLPVAPPAELEEPTWEEAGPPEPPEGVRVEGSILPTGWTTRREGSRFVAEAEGEEKMTFPWGREVFRERLRHEVDVGRPAHAEALGVAQTLIELEGRSLRLDVQISITSDPERFRTQVHRRLTENDRLVRERSWSEDAPRDHH
ncbi:MAG TPA: CocE/NonD family hydrolase [Actinomycetota bacterium]